MKLLICWDLAEERRIDNVIAKRDDGVWKSCVNRYHSMV